MYILWVDAASIIRYHNLDTRRQLLPRNTNCCTTFCMVKRIFHNIVDCLIQPITITKKRKMIRARQNDFFLFLSGSICKMQFNILHHICNIFCVLFQDNGSGIQSCNLEQTLHQCFDTVKFLLRQTRKFFHGGHFYILVLKESVINIECCQRCFQLV